MPTRTVQTIEGDIEYETDQCANCGIETVKGEMIPVLIDPYEGTCDRSFCSEPQMVAEEGGNLCGACADAIFGYERSGLTRKRLQLQSAVARNEEFYVTVVGILCVMTLTCLLIAALVVL